MNQRQRRMVGHGAIVMMFGLLAGFGLVMSLIGGFEIWPGQILAFELPADDRAWARAHAGGLMNGLMVFTFALLMWGLRLPEDAEARLSWMIVGAAYGNTIFYWGGMLASNRALSFGANRFGEGGLMAAVGLLPALVFAFVTLVAVVMLARHAFRSSPSDKGRD